MTHSRVLISVLNWNTAAATLACVQTLLAQTPSPNVEYRILVTDNGSRQTDYTELEAALPSGISLRRNPINTGFAGGHNQAIKEAIDHGMDFVWLFNSDAVLTNPATLAEMIELMRCEPRCGAVSPTLMDASGKVYFTGGRHDWASRRSTWTPLGESRLRQQADPGSCWISGAALLLRLTAVREVGLLNEDYFAYYEDNEICARLNEAGWFVRVAFDVAVQHPIAKRDVEREPYYFYLMSRNSLAFWSRFTPKPHRRLLRLRLLDQSLFDANRLYRDGFRSRGDASLLGIHDFMVGHWGPPALDREVPVAIAMLRRVALLQQRGALQREVAGP